MKIFTKDNSNWDDKVNFVDIHDVFVGYDMSQSCCEHAGWYITNKEGFNNEDAITPDEYTSKVLDEYIFTPDYFKMQNNGDDECDEFRFLTFRLEAQGKEHLYLKLFNCHNGYYSHGFEFKSFMCEMKGNI